MGGVTERRISKLGQAFGGGGGGCVFCEQGYWTEVATNEAIGPYSETAYGNEAGLVVSRELEALLPDRDRDPQHHLDHLPSYELLTEHARVRRRGGASKRVGRLGKGAGAMRGGFGYEASKPGSSTTTPRSPTR